MDSLFFFDIGKRGETILTLRHEYFILIFLSACGVLQASAAWAGLQGIMLFKKAAAGYLFAAITIGGAFSWFFASGNRNVLPVLEGSQQFLWFSFALFSALVLTLGLSSALKRRHLSHLPGKNQGEEETEKGLEALKRHTYLGAVGQSLRATTKDKAGK